MQVGFAVDVELELQLISASRLSRDEKGLIQG